MNTRAQTSLVARLLLSVALVHACSTSSNAPPEVSGGGRTDSAVDDHPGSAGSTGGAGSAGAAGQATAGAGGDASGGVSGGAAGAGVRDDAQADAASAVRESGAPDALAPGDASDAAREGNTVNDAAIDRVVARDAGDTRLPDGRSIQDLVLAVARAQIHPLADGAYQQGTMAQVAASRTPVGINWVYPWGVALYGMLRVSATTGDLAPRTFVLQHNQIAARHFAYLRWQQRTFNTLTGAAPLTLLMNLANLDSCGAMGSQMVEGVLNGGPMATAEQEELGSYINDYISTKQSRLPDGTFWRPEQAMTMWDDDLYMSCPFLVRWYQHTGNRAFLDDAVKQVLNMARRQQDTDGVWFHANFIAESATNGFKWGRANGWAMVATVEVLSAMPTDHPDRPAMLEVLRKHVEGIKPLQAPSGMWRQVLDHPELWQETSCSAMFTYSIARAVRRGWIDPSNLEVARRGFAGLSANVTPDGQVNETCIGTGIGRTLAFYADRPRPPNDLHGPGPVMLAGSELLDALNGR